MLRLEHLFDRLGLLMHREDPVDHHYALSTIFETMDVASRADLQRDTPYNTYTRHGLPPTPIAMVGHAALYAALHPQTTNALYFVAKGDGSHQFSATLDAHNRAVNRYQRGQP